MPGQGDAPSPISTDQLLEAVRLIITHLKASGSATSDDLTRLLGSESKELTIPFSLFEHENLSALEVISKYLHESGLNFRQIGVLLSRNERTIWTTYQNAKKKLSIPFTVVASTPSFPISILNNRSLSVLETIILHLSQAYTLQEISRLIKRPYSTVWATLRNARRKSNA